MSIGFNNEQGLVLVEDEWWFCNLNKWRYKKLIKEPFSQKQIKEIGTFWDIEKYIEKYWQKAKPLEYILGKLECKSILILMTMPIDPTENEWETYFFRDSNTLCLNCIHGCKQSSHVTVVSCPQHKKVKK